MLHTDARFATAVEEAVTRIEARTDAELVVVAAPRSGHYRDASLLAALVAAWLMLIFVLVSPFHFRPLFIPIELPLFGGLVYWLVDRTPGLLRRIVPRRRQQAQVAAHADQVFHEEVVHGTRNRTGLLIYVSALEDRVELRTDLGLDARVPQADWNAIRWGDRQDPRAPRDLEHFLAGLDAVGEVLAARVPATEHNDNEISDAPRIRS